MQTKHQQLMNAAWEDLYLMTQNQKREDQGPGPTVQEWQLIHAKFVEFYNALPPAPHTAAFLDELAGVWRRALKSYNTFYTTLNKYFGKKLCFPPETFGSIDKPAFEDHLADFAKITDPKRHYIPIFSIYSLQHGAPPAALDAKVQGDNVLTDKEIGENNKKRFLERLNLNADGIHKDSHHQIRYVIKFVCTNQACGAVDLEFSYGRQNRRGDEATDMLKKCTSCGAHMKEAEAK